jgi:hypothetical protein
MADKEKTKGFSTARPGKPTGPEPPYQRQDSRDRGSCCHEMRLIINGFFYFFSIRDCSLIELFCSLFVLASLNKYSAIIFCDVIY